MDMKAEKPARAVRTKAQRKVDAATVLEWLSANGPTTRKQVEEATGLPTNHAGGTLSELQRRGKAKQVGQGRSTMWVAMGRLSTKAKAAKLKLATEIVTDSEAPIRPATVYVETSLAQALATLIKAGAKVLVAFN